jgi:hypothetical protein
MSKKGSKASGLSRPDGKSHADDARDRAALAAAAAISATAAVLQKKQQRRQKAPLTPRKRHPTQQNRHQKPPEWLRSRRVKLSRRQVEVCNIRQYPGCYLIDMFNYMKAVLNKCAYKNLSILYNCTVKHNFYGVRDAPCW